MSTVADLYAAAPEAGVGAGRGEGYGPYARKPNTRGRVTRQGAEETLSWWIYSANFAGAVDAICGVAEVVTIFGQPVVRYVPMRHPIFGSKLFAEEVNWQFYGEGTTSHPSGHTHCRLDVTFRSQNYLDFGPMPFCELIGHPAQRSVPTPAGAWTVGGVAPHRDPDYGCGGSDFEIIMHHCPFIDMGKLTAYARYVNADAFLGCPPETVLYHGPRQIPQSQLSTAGQRVALSFTATSPEFKWTDYSMGDGTFGTITNSNGDKQYPAVNFGVLFA